MGAGLPRTLRGCTVNDALGVLRLYEEDVRPRLKQSTWDTKEHMVRTKILPYLGEKPLNEITSADVIRWQNELMAMRGPTGEPYRPTYLHTVSNQLSALLNHAVLHYNLPSNPARKVPKMGSKDAGEMSIWTKAQYLRFSRAIMDKPDSWMAFELLYWTGVREGELLALTPEDFDLERGTLSVTKTYHRRKGQDMVTPPKTAKANRRIVMPAFLVDEVRDHLALPGTARPGSRVFSMTKSRLYHEMERGSKIAGVPRIRVHDLRNTATCRSSSTWATRRSPSRNAWATRRPRSPCTTRTFSPTGKRRWRGDSTPRGGAPGDSAVDGPDGQAQERYRGLPRVPRGGPRDRRPRRALRPHQAGLHPA